jgi:hypothetical protein
LLWFNSIILARILKVKAYRVGDIRLRSESVDVDADDQRARRWLS